MANATIEIDDRRIKAALRRLAASGRDLTPAMRDIAGLLEASARRAFEQERSPDGKPWADLSDLTKRRRAATGHWPGQILQVTGRLIGSLASSYDATSAQAGTNLPQARTHQKGAKQGAYGRTRRGGPIPWGDIPARPFLGPSDT